MTILYRRLRSADCEAYRRLRLGCLISDPGSFASTAAEQPPGKLTFERYIEEDAPDHFIVGAFRESTLVAIVGFSREARVKNRHRGEIIQMCVQTDARGQGIGAALMRHMIAVAFGLEGLEQIQLGVASQNQTAIRLYEKLGFRRFGLQPRFYKLPAGAGYDDLALYQLLKCDYLESGA